MTSIVCGVGSAIFFASGSVLNSRATRLISGWSVVAWVMLVGLLLTVPLLAISGFPDAANGGNVVWLAVAGGGNVAGLVLAAYAFRYGKVAVVAPVLATEGALSAVIATRLGASLSSSVAFLLFAIVAGVVLAAAAPDPFPLEHERVVVSTVLAVSGALSFGVSLYAMARLSGELPISWVLLPARLVGVVFLLLPLTVGRRLQISRKAAPLVLAMGTTEVLGIAIFAIGARHDIVITSVLSSQFAPISAVLAYFLFGERLGRSQLVGVAIIIAGVTALSVVA